MVKKAYKHTQTHIPTHTERKRDTHRVDQWIKSKKTKMLKPSLYTLLGLLEDNRLVVYVRVCVFADNSPKHINKISHRLKDIPIQNVSIQSAKQKKVSK